MGDLLAKSRLGFIGIDVDSLHHYYPGQVLRQGQDNTETSNVIYDRAIPRYLDLFDRLKIRGTFFIVAKDVDTLLVKQRLREIVACGHEIASHSYSHPQHFIHLSREAKTSEIIQAEQILQQASGTKICGFRAPAWGIDEFTMDILEERGYSYDSSIMPTFWLPILKVGYFIKSKGLVGSGNLLGHYRYSFAPLEPYYPDTNHIERVGKRRILELPIAVVPFGRAPFWATIHLTANNWNFFSLCYWLTRRQLSSLHYECHAVDLLDLATDQIPSIFQQMFGLKHPLSSRQSLLKQILRRIHADYQLVTAQELTHRLQVS